MLTRPWVSRTSDVFRLRNNISPWPTKTVGTMPLWPASVARILVGGGGGGGGGGGEGGGGGNVSTALYDLVI